MCCGTDVGLGWEVQSPSPVSLRSRQWHRCESSRNRTLHVAPQCAPLWKQGCDSEAGMRGVVLSGRVTNSLSRPLQKE